MDGLMSLTLAAMAVVTFTKVGLRGGMAAPTWRVHQALSRDGRLEVLDISRLDETGMEVLVSNVAATSMQCSKRSL